MLQLQSRSYEGFFTVILSSNSKGTKQQYAAALKDFEKYCISVHNRTLDQMIDELEQLNTSDKILVLQEWTNLSQSSNRTKRARAGFVNKYLYYRGINIDSRDWKQLKFGKMGKSFKEPLTHEILVKIFNRSSYRRKTLYTFLISTGCRINEAVKIRKSDFDLSNERIKVKIYQSKNDETRIGFLTKECARMIKPLLDKINDNDLVFGTNIDADKSVVTESQCFRRVTDLLGLTSRRRSGVRDYTIHSLRGYTYTQFTTELNSDLAHAYVGHEQYLDTYLNIPVEDQLKYFLKVEPKLFINEAQPETDTVIGLRKQLEQVTAKASLVDDLTKRLDDQAEDIEWLLKIDKLRAEIHNESLIKKKQA